MRVVFFSAALVFLKYLMKLFSHISTKNIFHDQNAAAYFLIKIIVNADKLFIHKGYPQALAYKKIRWV